MEFGYIICEWDNARVFRSKDEAKECMLWHKEETPWLDYRIGQVLIK